MFTNAKIKSLFAWFIVWRYTRWALDWAEWEQYAEGHEANPCVRPYNRWSKLYGRLGYITLPRKMWVDAVEGSVEYKRWLRLDVDSWFYQAFNDELKVEVDKILVEELLKLVQQNEALAVNP